MPGADRFDDRIGDPPVHRAYQGEDLIGWVFFTQDIPPEQLGYSGPIRAVVGMDVDGRITGARVLEYYESYKSSMGDFLRRRGIQEQFAGKSIGDAFEVYGDVDGVSRATISTRAFARGIRNASRRVAEAYARDVLADASGPIDVATMSWFDMRTRGVLKRMLIEEGGGYLDISMAHLANDSIAEVFLGPDHTPRISQAAVRREIEEPEFLMYALEGPRLRIFVREGWYVEQAGDTVELPATQVYSLGLTAGGRVDGEAVMVGVMILGDELDKSQPFSMLYQVDGHEGFYSAEFPAVQPPPTAVAEEANGTSAEEEAASGAPETEVAIAAEPSTDLAAGTAGAEPNFELGEPAEAEQPAVVPGAESAAPEANVSTAVAPPESVPEVVIAPSLNQLGFTLADEQSELQRTLASASWVRVGWLLMVLALATAAFFAKYTGLRWVALAVTIVFLGYIDSSFLSISHITAGIWVGPGVYVRDLSLLIMVVFTLVTTLIWGRVFCGFLCPFGALQDFIERVVPQRFRRTVPIRWHLPALKVKYVILAIIIIPAIAGSRASLYQYFEPFGTVFFMSPNVLLWTIAGAFLLASAVVPRFYCRYACPLGAALAVTSFLSLTRIRRVEQCDHCKVCEQSCPTGAIDGSAINFQECVRCNICETKLIEKAGVCRHDMEEVRPRLVQLKVAGSVGAIDD
jgi:ferredoxin